MIRVLVSSCLLGEHVRYDGDHKRADSDVLVEWHREGRIVPFCPEVAGGLSVPRAPAEIQAGTGDDVLHGTARVVDREGRDVTAAFVSGAEGAVAEASRHGVRLAVLKQNSPSCGNLFIYDGTFTGARREGRGVAAAALTEAGVRVFSENEIAAAKTYLDELDAGRKGDRRCT